MALRRTLAALLVIVGVLTTASAPTQAFTFRRSAVAETYGDYSRMFARSAGQYWSDGQAFQWAWSPSSPTDSWVAWAKPWPADKPPSYQEHFVLSGDWVLIDGWADNGTYYKISTTVDWTAAGANCAGARTDFPTGGAQHYVRWTVPSTGYCAYAEGKITEQSSGKAIRYRHEQVWSPPAPCPANPFISAAATCVQQRERWSDDNGSPMAPRLLRDAWIARGYGMAWSVRNYAATANPTNPGPAVWRADGRYFWSW